MDSRQRAFDKDEPSNKNSTKKGSFNVLKHQELLKQKSNRQEKNANSSDYSS